MKNRHSNSPDDIIRLNKIAGHIRGISRMVEQDKPCDELLHQISAIQAAISKVGQLVLTDHIEECIVSRINDEEMKTELRLFKTALSRLIK